MFIGRTSELDKLNRLYNIDSFQMPVVYGRRRVGKTALINEFVKDKKAIYFTGIESNARQNLDNLSSCIFSGADTSPNFANFANAIEYVFELAIKERIILVIDEYPYLASAEPSLSSILQNAIDRYKDSSKLFLILCGSSMSFMEEQVLGYKSPLYGRRTAQFKIHPFTFRECLQYFKKFSPLDVARIYGVVGGTPQYLLQMSENLSVEDNIKQNILDKNSYLYEEPANLLKQEVREAANYNAIITAIATGSTRISEISSKAGESSSVCSSYIKKLIALGIVRKQTPIGEKSTKKTLYTLNDNLFRFWYAFISGNQSLLQNDMIDSTYNKIEPQLSSYMGAVFEEICSQHLWELNKNLLLPFTFDELGRWWGNNPVTKSQEEIDIMGTNGTSACFAECKWTNEKVDVSVLKKLVARGNMFAHSGKFYYVFSKSGFTSGCSEFADHIGNTRLVSFSEMYDSR